MKILRMTSNDAPSIDDCLAHRCEQHKTIPPIDDSVSDGSECSICLGEKFVRCYEDAVEKDILDKLYWPMVETARTRLNLVALGSGDTLVDEARRFVDQYLAARTAVSEGEGHAETRQPTPD